ncbi:hypothetical protein DPMN_129145 [Dreissena polymorpha]|uniref:Uncharacterized protein n=1 Tax=Dreissena polymorpha TaxID=45954 RepID=A0A9D4H270_DREPO|nr:hypothetical protein DPMN_129145 [Dreissena polymorpha]
MSSDHSGSSPVLGSPLMEQRRLWAVRQPFLHRHSWLYWFTGAEDNELSDWRLSRIAHATRRRKCCLHYSYDSPSYKVSASVLVTSLWLCVSLSFFC